MVCSKCPHHVAKLPLSLSPSLPACSEILRTIDSLQLTAYKKVATPANWKVNAWIGWLLWAPAEVQWAAAGYTGHRQLPLQFSIRQSSVHIYYTQVFGVRATLDRRHYAAINSREVLGNFEAYRTILAVGSAIASTLFVIPILRTTLVHKMPAPRVVQLVTLGTRTPCRWVVLYLVVCTKEYHRDWCSYCTL